MFFNNKFNTFFGLNLTLVYTFPMCMTWRFHFPLRNYDFKSKLCIYALKEIVETHRSLNGFMFMGLLDASKAFDRLKHSLLFEKLIDRNIPGYIIRIMMYWYASQTMYVR